MNPEAVYEQIADKSALSSALQALGLLDVQLQKNFFGDVEGVHTVHLALDALAYPLARLFGAPEDTELLRLADVVAYLVSKKCLDPSAIGFLRRLRAGIQQSTYEGLEGDDVADLEEARSKLHRQLKKLLGIAKKAPPDA